MSAQVYGTLPGVRLHRYHVSRTGIHSALVRTPYVVIESEGSMEPVIGDIPSVGGLALVEFYSTQNGRGGIEMEWVFEGFSRTAPKITQPTPDKPGALAEVLRRFDPTEQQASLLAHRRWESLAKKYGGTVVNGQPDFPSSTPASGSGYSSARQAARYAAHNQTGGGGGGNPFFGQKSYRSGAGVYSENYAALKPAPSIYDNIYTVVDAPSGLSKIGMRTPKGRNWLYLPPLVNQRGNAVEITERWELSGVGGHNREIYSVDAF